MGGGRGKGDEQGLKDRRAGERDKEGEKGRNGGTERGREVREETHTDTKPHIDTHIYKHTYAHTNTERGREWSKQRIRSIAHKSFVLISMSRKCNVDIPVSVMLSCTGA